LEVAAAAATVDWEKEDIITERVVIS